MKVKRVIVDKKPYNCLNCDLSRQYVDANWACSVTRRHIVTANPIPYWCPLEVETDGWIAVSERLPEDYTDVLIYDGFSGRPFLGYHVNDVGQWIVRDGLYFSDQKHDCITHWRPLPEAPKEVKDAIQNT